MLHDNQKFLLHYYELICCWEKTIPESAAIKHFVKWSNDLFFAHYSCVFLQIPEDRLLLTVKWCSHIAGNREEMQSECCILGIDVWCEVSEKLLYPSIEDKSKSALTASLSGVDKSQSGGEKIKTRERKSPALLAMLESGERRINTFYKILCEEIQALSHSLNKNELLHV